MERMLGILFQYSTDEDDWNTVIHATENTARQSLVPYKSHKPREQASLTAAYLVAAQFFSLLRLLRCLRSELRTLTERRSLLEEFIEKYYWDAPEEMEGALNEAFAEVLVPYVEPVVRELRKAEKETGWVLHRSSCPILAEEMLMVYFLLLGYSQPAAIQAWWAYFGKVGIGIKPRVLAILFRSIAMCEEDIGGRKRKRVEVPLTVSGSDRIFGRLASYVVLDTRVV